MTENTKEPWRVELRNTPIADTGDYEGVIEIFAGDAKRPIITMWSDDEEDMAIAHRIVACVNALADVPTETLVVLGDNFKATSPFALWENYCTVKAQRDELAKTSEALREHLLSEISLFCGFNVPESIYEPWCASLDDVLAKVGAGAERSNSKVPADKAGKIGAGETEQQPSRHDSARLRK